MVCEGSIGFEESVCFLADEMVFIIPRATSVHPVFQPEVK